MKYLVFDLETDIYKMAESGVASPFNKDNTIVAIGTRKGKEVKAIYLDKENYLEQALNEIPEDTEILIGHNIKFDLLWLWKAEKLQRMLMNGLKIYDTMLSEYILTAQQKKFAKLRDIAVNKYDCPYRDKVMEPYWEKNITTRDIPKELVLQDVKSDVEDTHDIMTQQIKKAKELGMYQLIMLENAAILATTEMFFNGMHVDIEVFNKNLNSIKNDLILYYKDAYNIAEKYWDD